jgi:RND family efflux transporter MFP subunit
VNHRAQGLGRFFLFAVLAGASGCSKHEDEASIVRPVLTTTVAVETTETFGPFAGAIDARYQTQLGFQIPGRIVSRDVQIGDLVRKGTRIAALDTAVLQFQVTSARADVANAEAQLAKASATEERQHTLLQTNATAQAVLDNAVAERETATARLTQARANLKKAQDQLAYTEIKAGFDGVVMSFTAEVGQFVGGGQTVVTIARPDVREAVFDVPDDLVGSIPQDATFNIGLQADETVTTQGRVREIAPQADAATRTRRIRLSLENASSPFRLGSTITVWFPRQIPAQIKLATTALIERDGKSMVWVVDPARRTVERVEVRITHRNAHHVTIAPTLKSGDRVVIAGIHSLRDGQTVKLGATQ